MVSQKEICSAIGTLAILPVHTITEFIEVWREVRKLSVVLTSSKACRTCRSEIGIDRAPLFFCWSLLTE